VLMKLQTKFEAQMAKKRAIEDNAARTRSRMEQVGLFVGYRFDLVRVYVGKAWRLRRVPRGNPFRGVHLEGAEGPPKETLTVVPEKGGWSSVR